MRIGILTGGGDVPGLNPCIKAVVNRAAANGWDVMGIRRGWAGLLNYQLDVDDKDQYEWVEPLSKLDVRTIDRYGGTFLHTSRTNPQKVRKSNMPAFLADSHPFGETKTVDFTDHVLKVLEKLGIDALIPIGGDDTLSYAARLHQGGLPGRRHPQDDGQRRLRHRLLHRLLHRRHPQRRVHPRRCARPSAATSASGWSSCSAATAARRPSSPATWRASTAR